MDMEHGIFKRYSNYSWRDPSVPSMIMGGRVNFFHRMEIPTKSEQAEKSRPFFQG